MIDLLRGDCRRLLPLLPSARFRCAVTSVPYWEQREYLPAEHSEKALEIGHEATPAAYVCTLVDVFREVRRCLAEDGTLWVNIGDKYSSGERSGLAPKNLIGLPWRLAFALQDDGWILRSDIIWSKPNAMPSSVTDRPTSVHEYVFLFSKSARYFFNVDAVREPHTMRPQRRPNGHKRRQPGAAMPEHTWSGTARSEPGVDGNPMGRNCRSVWEIVVDHSDGEHAAPMPSALARRCILAGSVVGDCVLDPFGGSGTVGLVAEEDGRHATLVDLDERAVAQARRRTAQTGLLSLAGGSR